MSLNLMVSGLNKQNTSGGLFPLPDTGLLFSAPGVQDSVTLRSFSSDSSRERGDPGLSEERATHQCLSEARERQTSDGDRLTLYADGAGGADRVQFSADLTAVASRVLHPNGCDLQRAVGVFSVSATIQIINYNSSEANAGECCSNDQQCTDVITMCDVYVLMGLFCSISCTYIG